MTCWVPAACQVLENQRSACRGHGFKRSRRGLGMMIPRRARKLEGNLNLHTLTRTLDAIADSNCLAVVEILTDCLAPTRIVVITEVSHILCS